MTTLPHWRDLCDNTLQDWLSNERLGIITDMDGTISPIVPHPTQAYPTPQNRRLLEALNERFALVAVVSGRSAEDVRQRVGLPQLVYVGNHGIERWHNDGNGGYVEVAPAVNPYLTHLQQIKTAIEAIAPSGVWVEDKRVTLSIHYRAHPNPLQFREEFLPQMMTLTQTYHLSLFEGRNIFEVRPPVNVDKGTIFAQLIEEYALSAAIYLGDDVTDADALQMAKTLNHQKRCHALGVAVLAKDGNTPQAVLSSADMIASSVDDVGDLLAWLLSASSTWRSNH